MRVWLYYRLSRDEDEELNSLLNQRSIIESYALSHGHTIVGESCDDNISGMHFDRDGIEQLTEAVDAGLIDAVIVKDLSRLGRHRTQTALYIDYLRKNHVRVLSATENIDTFNEADDLVIGFKGLMNDFYARDGSRRVTTGYRQKQKTGIVITPPFGYFKDKNISLIDQILADGQMTEVHLRLLIEKILVYETEGGLRLEIKVKAPFQNHTDTYENGVLTNSELEEIIKAG